MLDAILFGLIDQRLAIWTLVLNRHADVLCLGGKPSQSKPQRIGTELVDHVNRIDPVSFALGHRLPKSIKDLGMDVYFTEWYLSDVV